MARKKKHPEHVNHERWLISYADFITLLFAFFVVMFAVSQVDSKQVGRFTESFTDALEWQVFEAKGGKGFMSEKKPPTIVGQSVRQAGRAVLGRSSKVVREQIRSQIKQAVEHIPELKDLRILELRGELVLRLPEQLLFESGETSVNEDGQAALAAVADVLRDKEVTIRVEGHTDNRPIKNARFRSNWDLSAGRATSVVEYLSEVGRLDPSTLSVVGHGEFQPVAENDTEEGRAQNRRVDLVVIAASDIPAWAPDPTEEMDGGEAPDADAGPPDKPDAAPPREH
ncbi:MAG: OmpA family protein [Polyangiaceae bacterium]